MHGLGCDCPWCHNNRQRTRYLAAVFGALFVFGLFTVARALLAVAQN